MNFESIPAYVEENDRKMEDIEYETIQELLCLKLELSKIPKTEIIFEILVTVLKGLFYQSNIVLRHLFEK